MAAPPDFDALVATLRADPAAALELDLNEEQLLELRDRLNPYAYVGGPPRPTDGTVEEALVSYTNLRADYLEKFTMTGVVGFLFRVCREWTVPEGSRRWAPDKPRGASAPFTAEEVEKAAAELAESARTLRANEARAAAAAAAVREYDEKEVVFSDAEMAEAAEAAEGDASQSKVHEKLARLAELKRAAQEAEADRWGVLYMATLRMRNLGINADLRMNATEKAAFEHPKVKKHVKEIPDRFRGMLPGGVVEMPAEAAKRIIREFLENFFEYDPDAHVRSAYDEFVLAKAERRNMAGLPGEVLVDPFDPTRIPFRALLAEAPPTSDVPEDAPMLQSLLGPSESSEQHRYNALCHLLQCPESARVASYVLAEPARVERWRRMLLPALARKVVRVPPPQDTFHRLRWYCDSNMEAIRAATESIFNEKPDLDFALSVLATFKGTPAEAEKWRTEYRDRYQDKTITDIISVPMGGWTLLGSFSANRERVDFYNNHTELLKRIFERLKNDQKMGAALMRNRVRREKAENIRKEGPDAPGLGEYKSVVGLTATGAQEVLTAEDRLRLAKTRGDLKAAKRLEYLDNIMKRLRVLEEEQKIRTLSGEEERDVRSLRAEAEKARSMLEVPEGTTEVPVWNMNPNKGTVSRSQFYTLASDETDSELAAANVAAGQAQLARDFYPEAARAAAQAAFDKGLSAPPMADFAQAFDKELSAPPVQAEEE